MLLVAGRRVELIIEGHVDHRFNQMKVNEKVPTYILFFQLCFTKSPYPAYEILKLYLPYFELTESADEIAFDPDYIDG